MTAQLGEVDVPATTVSCAGCHGSEGRGKTEGGISPSNITWQHLTKPYGHSHANGRRHGPYNESAFIRSVVNGIDPAGNELAVAMPRYRMSPKEMADLIAYLKRIETDLDPGLTETSIKVGTLLPLTGPVAEAGQAIKEVLTAYFADLNSRGGVYNRRIELRVGEAASDKALTAANAKRLIEDEQIFSLVAGFTWGADRELAALAGDSEVPFIGPATLYPQTDFPLNRYLFYLLPGLKDQMLALVSFAANKPELQKSRMAIVFPDTESNANIAHAVEQHSKKGVWNSVSKVAYPPGSFDAVQLAAKLKQQKIDVLFFLGAGNEERVFLKQAEEINWTPTIFLLGSMIGRDLLNSVPVNFKNKIFLAYPTAPADVAPAGVAEFRNLLENHKLNKRHTAAQLSALAAAKILIEGLKLAGRDVSREKLVTALEGLYEFDTLLTPRVTFGPNRRTGARGAYVVAIDPEKKTLIAASEWINVN
ncbi:MAG: ABC transporter substrate-binding protein [Pyrinomonadaceae bacterium]|nr:ABC transporter substrate-binding protein [Pyrinomonadaceae bacterium]